MGKYTFPPPGGIFDEEVSIKAIRIIRIIAELRGILHDHYSKSFEELTGMSVEQWCKENPPPDESNVHFSTKRTHRSNVEAKQNDMELKK